jgi:mRNA interferase MazF
VVTVAPITSNVDRVFAFQLAIPAGTAGLTRDSKVQAEQVRTVGVDRLGERIGVLPPDLRSQLDAALRLHLGL